jgi:hypothetical protein
LVNATQLHSILGTVIRTISSVVSAFHNRMSLSEQVAKILEYSLQKSV